jgi:hypothetical protein
MGGPMAGPMGGPMMGGPMGHAPGRVVELDRNFQLDDEHPAQPPDDGFNPHGISVRPSMREKTPSRG